MVLRASLAVPSARLIFATEDLVSLRVDVTDLFEYAVHRALLVIVLDHLKDLFMMYGGGTSTFYVTLRFAIPGSRTSPTYFAE